MRRLLFELLVAVALLAVPRVAAADVDAFYQASAADLAGPPGSIIRTEPRMGAPLGARAWRVLYRSTGLDGRPIAVSGMIVVPLGQTSAGGRPVVAWAHPTSGIVPHCAPSEANFFFQQVQGLRDLVGRGYVVAATDYPGLGTPGPHPYLVGVSEGRAVLDIARAARALPDAGAGRRVALWGHSQGGQAVLYAAELARSYAPDLDVVGVAAAAPATDLGTLLNDDLATSGGKNLLAMTLWSWSRYYGAPLDQVVAADAVPTVNRLAGVCLESPIDIEPRAAAGRKLQKSFLKVDDILATEPWKKLLADNTIGTLPPSLPVFIAQGSKDPTVNPAVTAAYVKRLCQAGSRVATMIVPNAGHAWIARTSASAAAAWMADRFAGAPAPTDCHGG
jgi:acetyl esterase/lipase